jgi:hypothetical protein
MTMTKLRARVSPQAITKVTRIFNGTLDDIFNELFQNARRAGATALPSPPSTLDDACLITVAMTAPVLPTRSISSRSANPIGPVSAGPARTLPAWASSALLGSTRWSVPPVLLDRSRWRSRAMPGPARPTSMCCPGMGRAARQSRSTFRPGPDGKLERTSRQRRGSFRCRSPTTARTSPAPTSSPMPTRSSSGMASGSACSATGIRRTSRRSTSTG